MQGITMAAAIEAYGLKIPVLLVQFRVWAPQFYKAASCRRKSSGGWFLLEVQRKIDELADLDHM